MKNKLLYIKIPIGISIVLCTKGALFLGALLALIYFYFTYSLILNDKYLSQNDKSLYKKSPVLIVIALTGGVFESMFIYGVSILLYFCFILSIDKDFNDEQNKK